MMFEDSRSVAEEMLVNNILSWERDFSAIELGLDCGISPLSSSRPNRWDIETRIWGIRELFCNRILIMKKYIVCRLKLRRKQIYKNFNHFFKLHNGATISVSNLIASIIAYHSTCQHRFMSLVRVSIWWAGKRRMLNKRTFNLSPTTTTMTTVCVWRAR